MHTGKVLAAAQASCKAACLSAVGFTGVARPKDAWRGCT